MIREDYEKGQERNSDFKIREIVIESNKQEEKPVQIIQLTDLHISYINEEDKKDEEIMHTRQCRQGYADAVNVPAVCRLMKYASEYDCTVVTGDIYDYLSSGAIELTEKYVWEPYPEVIMAVGGHDFTRQMQTGIVNKVPFEERYKTVQKAWKHDIRYYARLIQNKVLVVAMDNNTDHYREWAPAYTEYQAEMLEADIKKARQNGYIILIFQHEPISTMDPKDTIVNALGAGPDKDFYNRTGNLESDDAATTRAYGLIRENADVVRGVFCGHLHYDYYTEICGSYLDENSIRQEKKIPQVTLACSINDDDCAGHALKIIVK